MRSLCLGLSLLLGFAAHAQEVVLDWDDQTWDPSGTGNLSETFTDIGGGDVTVSFSGSVLNLANPASPGINTFNTGGLIPPQNGLYVATAHLGILDPQITLDIDFSHANGVGFVRFTVFDLDGAGTFIDRVTVTACTDLTDVDCTEIAPSRLVPGAVNEILDPALPTDPPVAITGVPNAGSAFDSDSGNASFGFETVGIRRVKIVYENVITAVALGFQSITIHDIGFVPTELADLAVTKTADNLQPLIGEDAVFTIGVRNLGPDDATDVEVTDLLAAGLSYVSDNGGGAYDPDTGIWMAGDIAVGDTASLEITAEVNPTGPYINVAAVTGSQQLDPDPTNDEDGVELDPLPRDGPIAVNDSATGESGDPVRIDVLANDSGTGPLDIIGVTDPANGVVIVDDGGTPDDPSDDSIIYLPDEGFTGQDVFTYTITDETGLTSTAVVTVTVTGPGEGPDGPPVAEDDIGQGGADEPVPVDVLANDTGFDPLAIAGISVPPANGTAVIDDNGTPGNTADDFIVYTPDPGFTGVDTFEYTLTDASGETSTATVTMLVGPQFIRLTKTAGSTQVIPGGMLTYAVEIENISGVDIPTVDLVDVVPAGFSYIRGSARLDGSERDVTSTGDRPVTFTITGLDAGDTRILSYATRAGAGIVNGDYSNSISPSPLIGNESSATVTVTSDPDFEQTTIIGKVFNDLNADGWQDEGEEGIPGVRIASAQGLLVETDEFGRYHLAGIDGGYMERGRMFILKVDSKTLPEGTIFTTENPRVQRITQGLVNRFDFGVRLDVCCEVIEVKLGELFFLPGSAQIQPDYLPTLNELAERLREHGGGTLTIEGNAIGAAPPQIIETLVQETLARRLTPQFGVLKAELTTADRQELDGIVAEWRDAEEVQVTVVGHTSNVRIAPQNRHIFPDNQALSEARAAAVGDYVRRSLSLDASQIDAWGCGLREPVRAGTDGEQGPPRRSQSCNDQTQRTIDQSNATQAGKDANRRVELQITGRKSRVVTMTEEIGSPAASDRELAERRARAVYRALRELVGPELMRLIDFQVTWSGHAQPASGNRTSAAPADPGLAGRAAAWLLDTLVGTAHAGEQGPPKQRALDTHGFGQSESLPSCSAETCRTEEGYAVRIITHTKPRPAAPGDTAYVDESTDRVDVSGRFTVRLREGGEIWATEDPAEVEPRLAVSGPLQAPVAGGRLGEVAPFYAFTNYTAFIARAEFHLYHRRDVDRVRPLLVRPVELRTLTRIILDGAEIDGRIDDGDELVYMLRVYDAEGRFDETRPRGLIAVDERDYIARVETPLERDIPSDRDQERNVTPGELRDGTPLDGNVLVFLPEHEQTLSDAIDYTLTPHFDTRKTVLKPEDRAALDAIADVWRDAENVRVHVVGHTDNVRIAPANRHEFADNYVLSQARAWSVAKYLKQSLGLRDAYLSASGRGPDEPVADNRTAEGRSMNRRVELHITGERKVLVAQETEIKLVEPDTGHEADVFHHGVEGAEWLLRAQGDGSVLSGDKPPAERDERFPDAYSAQASSQGLDAVYGANHLGLRTIPIRGSRVRLRGHDLDGNHSLFVNGNPVPIDLDGKFAAEYVVPIGEHMFEVTRTDEMGKVRDAATLPINVTGEYMFIVGMANLTLTDNNVSGSIEPLSGNDRYDEDFLVEGQLAFYLKGKIKGKYLITAQLDTTEDEVGDLGKDIGVRDPEDVFRRLDPDRYYPVYGDDSTTISDTDSQGRYYLRLDWDNSVALWGNYNTGFTGTEFAQYNRSLYGAKVHYKGTDITEYGEPRLDAQGFVSEVQTALGHTEFRGTAGSVYYLRDRNVLPGSEKVHVEVRDRDSARVLENLTMQRGRDYEIDELQGRIILARPLSSVSEMVQPNIVKDQPLDGNVVVMLVDYEYVPGSFFEDDNVAFGGRGKYWVNDSIGIGATYVDEDRGTDDYSLYGGDLTLRAGRGTFLKLEYATSEARQTERFLSDNGGLSFTDVSAGTAPGRDGDAYGVEARVNTREWLGTEREWTGAAWWRDTDEEFSVARRDLGQDRTEYGLELTGELGERFTLAARAAVVEVGDDDENRSVSVQADYALGERSQLSGEIRYVSQDRLTVEDNDGTVAALRYTYALYRNVDLYGIGQFTLDDDDGAYEDNDLGTVGLRLRMSERTTVIGEYSSGDRGDASSLTLDHRVNDRSWIYGTFTQSTDRTEGYPGDQVTVGHRTRIGNQAMLFNEAQFQRTDRFSGLSQVFGLDFSPAQAWTVGVTVQTGKLEGIDGVIDRDAFGGGVAYRSERMQASTRAEYRNDDGATNARQWLSSSRLDFQINDDLAIISKANWSDTEDQSNFLADAKFWEASFGLAYRPVANDRLNLLSKITYLYDLPGLEQQTTSTDQRSLIASVEGIYRLFPRWELGGKLARRVGELREGRGEGDWYKSTTNFGAVRTRYHMLRNWDGLIEYRILDLEQANNTRQGWLVALDRHIGDNFKLGVGFNFTDFSDDLTDLDYDQRGWFINALGKY